MATSNTKPSYIPKPFAQSGSKNTIPEADQGNYLASWNAGFPTITSNPLTEGGLPPDRLDFNGILNLVTSYLYYMQNGGYFTYDGTVASKIGGYPEGAVLLYKDSSNNVSLVRSTKNNNLDNFVSNPSFIGTSWVYATPSFNNFKVVDSLPGTRDANTFYFVKG